MLLDTLKEDCEYWINSNEDVFLSEHDMQCKLASFFEKTGHYKKVHVEYAVPLASLKAVVEKCSTSLIKFEDGDFPWKSQMFIDIVVEDGANFAAVELKYATTSLDADCTQNPKQTQARTVFGEVDMVDVIKHIKHKGAHDIVMYGYWKDVRRIEALTCFPRVVGGIALIVSNDNVYWGEPTENSGYAQFSMYKGVKGGEILDWGAGCEKTQKGRPPFKLAGSYECKWEKTSIPYLSHKGKGKGVDTEQNKDDRSFRYMLSVIPAESIAKQIQESKEDK